MKLTGAHGSTWMLGHRPALDGLRGVAVLLVVMTHLPVAAFSALGNAGVTAFFTLSGFLVTAILLEQRDRDGRISVARFYVRRARRLLPALMVLVGVMLVLGLTLSPEFATPKGAAWSLLYLGNWWHVFGGDMGGLAHTWSLAIEEQFYLVWPVALVVAHRRGVSERTLIWGFAAAAVTIAAARFLLWDGGDGAGLIYNSTITRADALLVGAAVALALRGCRARRSLAPTLLIVLTFAPFALEAGDYVRVVVLPTVVAVGTGLTIWSVCGAAPSGWLGARWLTLVGRRSYGLYLWHYPLLSVAEPRLSGSSWVTVPLLLAMAWGLTLLSWRYIEEPFLRRRSVGAVAADNYQVGSHVLTHYQ